MWCRHRTFNSPPSFLPPGPKQCHLVQGFPCLVQVLQPVNIKGAPLILAADIQDDTALVFKGVDLMEEGERLTAVPPRQDLCKEVQAVLPPCVWRPSAPPRDHPTEHPFRRA